MKSSTKIRIMEGVLRNAAVLLLVWLGTLVPAPYLLGALRELGAVGMWSALGFAMGMGVLGVALADLTLTRILGQSVSETLAAMGAGYQVSQSGGGASRGRGGGGRNDDAAAAPPPENVHEHDGVVIRYNQEKGYGFLQASDLRDEPFFHRNDVVGIPLEQLRPGLGVRFAAFDGPKGMRAQKVWAPSD